MIFSSVIFLFLFLPAVYLLYLILRRDRARNALLLTASIAFYAWGEARYVLLLVLSVFLNWAAGLLIERYPKGRKALVILAVCLNLSLLAYFKYTGMFFDAISHLTGVDFKATVPHLPIGISFFTFQSLSYVLDVSRGETTAQKHFGKLFLYISFFPQLIAGPIVKYHDISAQLEHRTLNADATAAGIRRFITGLSKKLLIADVLAVTADRIFGDASLYNLTACAWLGAVSYALQIYFDFSGYSDMAIGLGKIFGFEFRENFQYPYTAGGMRDFWRRWHISLSSWFREYLYIPLGGSRRGQARTCLNIMLVFLLTGLWHGANYTFLLWGLYNGALLVLERLGIIRLPQHRFRFLTHLYTILAITLGFVIFRSDSLAIAGQYLISMFRLHSLPQGAAQALSCCTPYFVFTLAAAVIAATPIVPALRRKLSSAERIAALADVLCCIAGIGLFLCCAMAVASNSYSPFIYFRF